MSVSRVLGLVVLAAIAAGCDHSSAFEPPPTRSTEPRDPAVPVRLTYGGASSQAWLTGETLVYSGSQPEHSRDNQVDVCLGILPATGGQRIRSICNASAFDRDTLDDYSMPAPLDDSLLAFRRSRTPFRTGVAETAIMVSTIAGAPAGQVVRSLPFQGADAFIYDVADLAWLTPDTLMFLGLAIQTVYPCPTCDPVSFRSPAGVFRLATSGASMPEVIPGTQLASSVTRGASAHELYLTFPGEPGIVHLDLLTGDTTTVAQFAAGSSPDQLDYRDGHLAAVVSGATGVPEIRLVDLASGAVSPLVPDHLLVEAPRLGPSARSLTVLGRPYVDGPGGTPIPSAGPDLYRYELQ